MMSVAILDYDAGNLRSVETAFTHIGAEHSVIRDPEDVVTAERLVVPGVGDARAAMETLRSRGLDTAIHEFVRTGRPLLGICLGSQIVLDRSEENDAACLGLIPGETVAIPPGPGRKIPHMGWNTVQLLQDHAIFSGIDGGSSFYFVHSYVPRPADPEQVLAICEYGETFAAVVGRDNVVASQFHPEKSARTGLRMLSNFLSWRP